MLNLPDQYLQCKNTQTDINEHLETLFTYASHNNIKNIIEFGTRFGDSTTAFLYAIEKTDKTFQSYDLFRSDNINDFEQHKNYKFNQEDTLQCNISETDILFIDTLHTYFQLYSELKRHSKQVKKYIILHDTTSFGISDETLYSSDCVVQMSNLVSPSEKQGLIAAINDFLVDELDGINWEIKKIYTNNNGLTIIQRINKNE